MRRVNGKASSAGGVAAAVRLARVKADATIRPATSGAIERLTGRSCAQVEDDLAMWSAQDDVPLYRSGGTWRLVSHDDAWDLVHPPVTATDLTRFQVQEWSCGERERRRVYHSKCHDIA